MTSTLHIVDHPLVQHKLTLLRSKETSTRGFRALCAEIGALLVYELMRDARVAPCTVQRRSVPHAEWCWKARRRCS